MEYTISVAKRVTVLVGVFLFLLLSGVASMQLWGGSSGTPLNDVYLVLSLFTLEGDWVFEGPSNPFLKTLAFVAPLFTVLGFIELFTRKLIQRIVQAWRLFWIRDHVVIFGLSAQSVLLVQALRQGAGRRSVAVIDPDPNPRLAARCRRLGVPVIAGDPGLAERLGEARLHRAASAVSFLADSAAAMSLVFSAEAYLHKGRAKPIDLWLKFKDPEFGRRLGDYFKFADLSGRVHPRFFNLKELAARRLVRLHPPDVYADAFGQAGIHLAVYAFEGAAFQVIEEALLQHLAKSSAKPRVTILTADPAACRAKLFALLPQISKVADIHVEALEFYTTGIADQDYEKIPKDVTMHIICHQKADLAAATGLSLRRMLLTPPAGFRHTASRRLNAPVFVWLASASGIGQLLRSNIDDPELEKYLARTKTGSGAGEIPDGLYAFGMVEDLLAADQGNPMVPTVVDTPREEVAKYLHCSYTFDRAEMAEMFHGPGSGEGNAMNAWEKLAPEFRESCRQEADHLWAKARVIHCKLVKRETDAPSRTPALTGEEKNLLAMTEHRRWMTERLLSGWVYDAKRVDEARRHNLLRPWEELSKAEATMDLQVGERLNSAAGQAGLELRRERTIGIIGHKLAPGRPFDEDHIRAELKKAIQKIIDETPDRTPVIMTPLADGADTIAAEIAIEWKLPFVAPLPLPFEVYRQDFAEGGEAHVRRFLNLVAVAEKYIELPLRFGDLVDVASPPGEFSEARKKQYALAGAYIVERSDDLIAVWDGKKARGIGGTAQVISWRSKGVVPENFSTDERFYIRPKMKPPIIISPIPS